MGQMRFEIQIHGRRIKITGCPPGRRIHFSSFSPSGLLCRFLLFFLLFFFFLFSSACPSRFEHRPTWKWVKRSVHLDLNHFALEILFRSALNLAFRAKHDREKSFSSPVSMEKDRMEEGFYFLPLLFCTNLSRSHLRRLVMGAGYNTLDT